MDIDLDMSGILSKILWEDALWSREFSAMWEFDLMSNLPYINFQHAGIWSNNFPAATNF